MKLSESKKICTRYLFLFVAAMFFAGCGGDAFEKTVPQGHEKETMFVVTEWKCPTCGEIIIRTSYGNGDAYGFPMPYRQCKGAQGVACLWEMQRWKRYDWNFNVNKWEYWGGEDFRKKEKEETQPKAEQSTAAVTTESKPTSSANPNVSKQERNDIVAKNSVSNTPLDEHWFTDIKQGVLIWNPNPEHGESVEWNGGFVQDGAHKYADGNGEAKWYLNGQFEQSDKGYYEHGKRHGRFTHVFSDGRTVHSEWQHGIKIQ